jgi:type VI secretion system secreted protein VgrG
MPENRFLTLTTPLGLEGEDLILERLDGEEGLSRPFSFRVSFWCSNVAIAAADLVNKSVTVTLTAEGTHKRYFHGFVRHLQAGEINDRGSRHYQAEIVPRLRLLAEASNSRIFEDKSAVEIVKSVFALQGLTDYDAPLQKTYNPRKYCVQYRETDFNFVSRLLEEEGIFYFFKHAEGKHTLVLADDVSAYQDCRESPLIYSSGTHDPATVRSWDRAFDFVPGKWVQSDYNYLTPSTSLLTSVNVAADKVPISQVSQYQMYDYPGAYDARADGDTLTRIRMEEEEALHETLRLQTRATSVFASGKFKLEMNDDEGDYPEKKKIWAVVSVRHHAHDDSQINVSGGDQDYSNEVVAIPSGTLFRPRRTTPKPHIHGLQTAVVTGPSGEEIYPDKYGRVQVLFFWDREKKNSCWIRVAQPIAGRSWGMQYLPRIGHEVVVSFLEGDPDRPLITGSVYNADNMPPYTLPDNKTQSGYKTRSSMQGGADNFNELRFEDKKGSEDVYFHAEKDFHRIVEHDDDLKVDHDQIITVKNDRTETVKDGNEKVTIEKGNRTVTVSTGNDTHEVKQGNRAVTIAMGNDSLEIKMGNQTTKLALGAASTEAMQSIELKVGQSSVKIDQMGVTIKGMTISIEGQLKTEVKGLMTDVKGDAMLTLKGGITMIG